MGKLRTDLGYIVDRFRELGLNVAFAESCTGGRLAADLTTVPGSSDIVAGSAVCYQLEAKHRVLGLDEVTEDDVVSEETARKMAFACRRLFDVEIGVGTTGLLDGNAPHAFFAVAGWTPHPRVRRVDFVEGASRDENRETLVAEVFQALREIAG